MQDSIIRKTDAYKLTHWCQYPPGTRNVYAYFESRGGPWRDQVFAGLQYVLEQHMVGPVLDMPSIRDGQRLSKNLFGSDRVFNYEGWKYLLDVHQGCLPISICAVPEGTVVPCHNVLMTVEATDPNCYWLPNYLETILVQTWYPCTVATQSREMKALLLKYLKRTGDPSLIDYKLHDFGYRGVSSHETAGIGGAAHLINFKGTDTLAGITVAEDYYGARWPELASSVPAAEHSTITSWGRAHEEDAMRNMLDQYPDGYVAVVSDSFDIFEACENIWGGSLKEKILGRKGTLIVRPDSGDPPTVLASGTPNVLGILGEKFGYSINSKGYRVLDPHIRVIQGDGIDFQMLDTILYAMQQAGWSADNVAFGSGGGLLQKLNRDTMKFAFKCAWVDINGEGREVFKSPITDRGKQSKSGRLKLIRVEGAHGSTYNTVKESDPGEDQLVEVFRDGELLVRHNFEDVRKRAAIS